MYTVLLPPGDNPIAVNKYIIYHNVNEMKVQFSVVIDMSQYNHRRNRKDIQMKKCQL